MRMLDWLVIAAGLTSVAWVNWYFLLGERGIGGAHLRRGDASRPLDRGAIERQ